MPRRGQHGVADFNNPYAIAVLFALGGLWVTLLAFGLRGMHGLRMWPYMPRLLSILRVLRRHARRTPIRQWRVHALIYMLAGALGGVIVNMAQLPRGYWLTLAVFTTLQMDLGAARFALCRPALNSGRRRHPHLHRTWPGGPAADGDDPAAAGCARQGLPANHYGLFVLQTTLLFLLLAETLAQDWNLPQIRLINASLGVGVALLIATLMHLLHLLLARRSRRKAQLAAAQRTDEQTTSRS